MNSIISDFQWALVGIVIVLVVLVLIYNRWQEAKYKRRAEAAFSGDHPDVLVEGTSKRERVEPKLGGLSALEPVAADAALTPIADPGSAVAAAPHGHAGGTASPVNPETDSVALILADSPIEPDRYHEAIGASQHAMRGISWEGMVSGLWRPVPDYDTTRYREMRVGIQLADRSGPVSADLLRRFNDMVSAFAGTVNAVSQREDVKQAEARATEVDHFCADTDVEICINVVGKNGVTFAVTKVRGLAEAQGMTPLDSGEYVMKDELARVHYVLRNYEPGQPAGIKHATSGYLNGLTFALDLPRTERPVKVFEQMVAHAIKFADVLNGEVVDDNKKVLTANGRKVIADTIATITARMIAKGVEPGSAIALRLYA